MITYQKLKRELDQQILDLEAHPEHLQSQWFRAEGMFRYIKPYNYDNPSRYSCGCITMIRDNFSWAYVAPYSEEREDAPLVKAIQRSKGPKQYKKITSNDFTDFRKWQLRTWSFFHGKGKTAKWVREGN